MFTLRWDTQTNENNEKNKKIFILFNAENEANEIVLDEEENNKIYNGNYCVIKDKLECT